MPSQVFGFTIIAIRENIYRAFVFEGLISMVFLVLSVLQGFGAYFASELRRFVNPIYSKFLHNLTSVMCFVVGMASLIYGYLNGMMILYSTSDARYTLIAIAVVTSILSLIGPACSAFNLVNLKILHQRSTNDDKLRNLR
jgi:Eukaryotic cytochrome b561